MMLERTMPLYSSWEASLLRSTISTGSFRNNVLPRGRQNYNFTTLFAQFKNYPFNNGTTAEHIVNRLLCRLTHLCTAAFFPLFGQ